MILQSAGLPLYAQSFEFDSDEACQSFNNVIRPTSTTQKDAHLMGGFFNAMQIFGDDMIKDKLNLIDLGFTNFEIMGIIKDEVFFIGIFQNFPEKEGDKDAKVEFLDSIASRFIHRYPISEIQSNFVSHANFRDFTDIIMDISQGEIKRLNCRDCLTKCSVENKGCLPHNFYFENVNIDDGDGMIYLK